MSVGVYRKRWRPAPRRRRVPLTATAVVAESTTPSLRLIGTPAELVRLVGTSAALMKLRGTSAELIPLHGD